MRRRFAAKYIPILILLTCAIVFSCGRSAVAGISPAVTFETGVIGSGDNGTIYALTVKGYSPYGISVISTVISFDKSAVIPVNSKDYKDVSGAEILSLKTMFEGPYGDLYSAKNFWHEGSYRNCFQCDLYSTAPLRHMDGAQPLYRFTFRLGAGTDPETLLSDVFRVETDKSPGSFLAAIYRTPESLEDASGISLIDKDPAGDTLYSYYPKSNDSMKTGLDLLRDKPEDEHVPEPPTSSGGGGSGLPSEMPSEDKLYPAFFSDVNEGDWFYDAVMFLAERGITTGTSAKTFSPGDPLTRGQLLVLVMRAYGLAPDEVSRDNFLDAGDTYYTGYLSAAKRLGIADGVGNNMFLPERPCTRQEMFKLVYGALNSIGELPTKTVTKKVSDFNDGKDVDDWAVLPMNHLLSAGFVSGMGDNRLEPGSGSNRAQMAQLLYNLLRERYP